MSTNNNTSIARGFCKSFLKFPKRKAFFANDRFYSYEELMVNVWYIYQEIEKRGLNSHNPYIGLYFQSDIQSYAALLAISLSGAAYVPLNPKFPNERNQKIIDKAGIRFVLYSGELSVSLQKSKIQYFDLQTIETTGLPPKIIPKSIISQPIAYLLFTSGTTGEPKGVPVSKKNVHHLLDYFLENSKYAWDEEDRFLQVYELSFDVSVFSFFVPLSIGACCYVLPQKGIRYLNILKLLRDYEITVASMASTTLHFLERYMDEVRLPALKNCLLTADALHHALAVKWSKVAQNAVLENFYGPTEATVWCTSYPWKEVQAATETVNGVVAIGKPLKGLGFLLIDEDLEVVEEGEAGELCISGPQVVSSYLNNEKPEAFFTKEKVL